MADGGEIAWMKSGFIRPTYMRVHVCVSKIKARQVYIIYSLMHGVIVCWLVYLFHLLNIYKSSIFHLIGQSRFSTHITNLEDKDCDEPHYVKRSTKAF